MLALDSGFKKTETVIRENYLKVLIRKSCSIQSNDLELSIEVKEMPSQNIAEPELENSNKDRKHK